MIVKKNPPLNIVLCWHMHQPDYRDHARNEFRLPWVYLHGIKDYVDMAAYLETTPGAKAVVNFSPILIEQLDDYERQISNCLETHEPIRDPMLSALDMPVFPADMESRVAIVKACMRSNRERQINRFPAYKRLAQLADLIMEDPASSAYLSNQYLADLISWYHLAWLGETVRRTDPLARQLIEQQYGYTLHQRRQLLELIGGLVASIRTRYSELARSGRVELSMSPYSHPILPLLKKFNSAREAMPDVHLPILAHYPGGEERIDWHIQHGLAVFQDFFGVRPAGFWPSEGSISADTIASISAAGFQWTATGESVMRNSLNASQQEGSHASIYRGFKWNAIDLPIFARDDTLSDLIGFTYSDWHADDAVADIPFTGWKKLQRQAIGRKPVSYRSSWMVKMPGNIILKTAITFLSALYKRLTEHPQLKLTTYQEILEHVPVCEIDTIVSGSWVYGTFSTWVGDADKNHGWDILCDAKRVYDEIRQRSSWDEEWLLRINRQLAACEGSDWFWWFGDYNPAETVSDFEQLFRLHLANLYQILDQEPPSYLSQVLAQGTGTPSRGGVIRPGSDSHQEKPIN